MKILKHNLVYLFSLLIFISGFAMLFSNYCHAESNNTMIWPLSGPITSEYGWRTHPIYGTQKFHSGLDIGGEYGLPIQAAAAGTVSYAGWISGYGNTVMIDHGGGVVTLYGHNESLNVQVGQLVGQGQIIAMCGSTGNSTGPHCHFEVEVNGEVVSPYLFLSPDGHMPPYGGSDFFKSDYNFLPMDFNAANDIAKPMKDETDAVVSACLKAMKILREKLAGLLIVLMTIDLALAAMWQLFRDYVPSGSGQSNWSLRSFMNWLLRRMIFYGILVFIFNNWTDYYVNIIMDLFTGMGVGLVVGAVVFICVWNFGDYLTSIFTTDSAVIRKGAEYLRGFAPETIVTAILFSMVGFFNGNEKTVWVMIQGLIQTLLVRLPLAYIMSIQPHASLTKIGLAAPVATCFGIVLNVIFYIVFVRKNTCRIKKK